MTQGAPTVLTSRVELHQGTDARETPLREVLVDLWENSQELVRQEFELASIELDERIKQAKKDGAAAVTGGAVLYGGVLCLHAMLILLLSKVMDAWVAALIVGALASAAGAALLMKARQDVQKGRLAPKRTMTTVRQDVNMMKEVTR